ncbi:MAG: aldo/keto reductase [Azonexus sp.]|nr:aldo/keto reductase [Azonexus sp.]
MNKPISSRRRQLLAAGAALSVSGPLWATSPAPDPPLTRKVPSSGVALPVVGIGTNRFRLGDDAWMKRLRGTLIEFIGGGGTVIDTAPSYGDSEQAIGTLLAGAPGLRQPAFLATKVDRDAADEGREQLEKSFAALHTERLDLVQLHNLHGVDKVLPVLREQKAAGRIGHIGITTSEERQYAEMEAILRRESFDFIQINYAVGNRKAEERLLPLAADRGMAVLVNLPLGRGAQFRAVGERPLPPWAMDMGCYSWAQVFLKFVVSHPAVTCAIPGSTQAAHVADNLGAARGRFLEAAERQTIARYFDTIADG